MLLILFFFVVVVVVVVFVVVVMVVVVVVAVVVVVFVVVVSVAVVGSRSSPQRLPLPTTSIRCCHASHGSGTPAEEGENGRGCCR